MGTTQEEGQAEKEPGPRTSIPCGPEASQQYFTASLRGDREGKQGARRRLRLADVESRETDTENTGGGGG